MQGEAGLHARGRTQQFFWPDSERFRWSRTRCGLPLSVQEHPDWCPSTLPLLGIAPEHGWPPLQHSPDALVVSRCSPEGRTIIPNLVQTGDPRLGGQLSGAVIFTVSKYRRLPAYGG
jgi:hypothetical protein